MVLVFFEVVPVAENLQPSSGLCVDPPDLRPIIRCSLCIAMSLSGLRCPQDFAEA